MSRLVTQRLSKLLPTLDQTAYSQFDASLQCCLETLLTAGNGPSLPPLILGRDAFGDPFDLERMPLSRSGTGYAVQQLGSDTLLDRVQKKLLPIRHPDLDALFESFDQAYEAARGWLVAHPAAIGSEIPLAIVPAFYDEQLHRHVLIHGVLPPSPLS